MNSPEHPWEHISFDRTTDARGRNGVFVLHEGTLNVYGGVKDLGRAEACLRLYSKQPARTSPIAFYFTNSADIWRLGKALCAMAAHWDAQASGDVVKEEV